MICTIQDNSNIKPGKYWLVLYENYNTDTQSVVSVGDEFELTSESCSDSCCESGEVTIGGDSSCTCAPNLELGVQGDSAYEVWLKNGHEGTQEDYITWLQQPSVDAAGKAERATETALQASAKATASAESADTATVKAGVATEAAKVATETANEKAEIAEQSAKTADESAQNASAMASEASTATAEAKDATQQAKEATALADASAKMAETNANYAKEQGDYAKSFNDTVKALSDSVDEVNSKIPDAATADNQLADKDWVNSSITTTTATFRGTFETVDDLPTDNVKANDYAFVISADESGNPEYGRYKYSNGDWVFEYTLNNSSFTADQWKAINSGITDSLITSFKAKYDKPSAGIPKSDLAETVQTSLTNADTAYGWGNHSTAGYAKQTDLSAEQSARESADTTNANAIATEASTRESNDATLQGNIDTLTTKLNNEATTRDNADTVLTTNLNAEVSARQAAITTVKGLINDETTARKATDTTLQTNIDNEVTARNNAITAHNSASDSHSDIRNLITDYFNILMDGVFIMFHRKSDNYPLMVKPNKWASYQNSGEIAEGVVVVEGGKILVVAPTEANNLYWSSAAVSGGGKTATDRLTALDDWSGKENADAQITHSECNTASYAPGYCALYSRVNANGKGLTAGRWWLPSLGELMMIYANMRKINYALSLIEGATQLAEMWYWSSTEFSATDAWGLNLDNGDAGNATKTPYQDRVRAVSAFLY